MSVVIICRIYRRMSSFSEPVMQVPPAVVVSLRDIENWSFDIFELDERSDGNAMRYMGRELLRSQGIISKYRVSFTSLL